MREQYYLGIDVGSSSIKGVLADARGRIAAQKSVSYDISQPFLGWAEEDPELWWNGTVDIFRHVLDECPGAAEGIRGVFITGMVPNLVPLDGSGHPVRPAILYRDNRAVAECGELTEQSGIAFNMQDVLPKLAWIRKHEPEAYRSVRSVLNTHSYLVYRLTGVLNADADISALWGEGVFSAGKGWNLELIERLGFDGTVFPRVFYPGQAVGTIDASAAEFLGIGGDVAVFAGNGDSFSSMLGTGVTRAGDVMIYLGTAATLWYLDTDLDDIADGLIFGSGKIHFAGNTLSGGELLRWFRYGLQLDGEKLSFGELDRAAEDIPPGAGGLFVLPHFMGRRTPQADPGARGAFLGLAPVHTAVHVYRAIMEGITFNLLDSFRTSGFTARRIAVTGGGAVSPVWRRIIASIFDQPVEYYEKGNPALGDAYFAGYCLGDFRDFGELRGSWLGDAEITSPDPRAARAYKRLFETYLGLEKAWSDCFPLLAGDDDIHT